MQPRLTGIFPLTVKSAAAAPGDLMSRLGALASQGGQTVQNIWGNAGNQLSGFMERVNAGDPQAIQMMTSLVGGGIGGVGGMLMGGEGNRILGGLAGAGIGAGLGAGAGYLDQRGYFGEPGAIDRGWNQGREAINQFAPDFGTQAQASPPQPEDAGFGGGRFASQSGGSLAGMAVGYGGARGLTEIGARAAQHRANLRMPALDGMRVYDRSVGQGVRRAGGRLAPLLALAGAGAGAYGGGEMYDYFKQSNVRKSVLQRLGLSKRALSDADLDALLPDNTGAVGGLSDIALFPGAQRRAGRASALAESMGNEASLGVDMPRTARILKTLLASAAGAGLGAAGAAGVNYATSPDSDQGSNNIRNGIMAGAGAGSLAGFVTDILQRRSGVAKVKADAKADLARGKRPATTLDRGNILASLISGVHQQGRADTLENITQGKRKFRGNPGMTIAHAGSALPVVSPIFGLGGMAGSVANFLESRNRMADAKAQPTRSLDLSLIDQIAKRHPSGGSAMLADLDSAAKA